MGGMIVPSWFCYFPLLCPSYNCAMIHLSTGCQGDHLFSWKSSHRFSTTPEHILESSRLSFVKTILDQWLEMMLDRSFNQF